RTFCAIRILHGGRSFWSFPVSCGVRPDAFFTVRHHAHKRIIERNWRRSRYGLQIWSGFQNSVSCETAFCGYVNPAKIVYILPPHPLPLCPNCALQDETERNRMSLNVTPRFHSYLATFGQQAR